MKEKEREIDRERNAKRGKWKEREGGKNNGKRERQRKRDREIIFFIYYNEKCSALFSATKSRFKKIKGTQLKL